MKHKVREAILGLVRQRRNMKDLGEDDNFFDLGVSSLTIIELQIGVEEALGVALPTGQLMRLTTLREWIEAYTVADEEQARGIQPGARTDAMMGEAQ